MAYSKTGSQPMPFLLKGLCIAAIACCVVIGLIGLVLPIIPGFLFLFFAVFLLARISTRFESILKNNASIASWKRHWHSINALSITQRIKLSFWVFARTIVSGISSGVRLFKRASDNN